jgi:hypothetical protein
MANNVADMRFEEAVRGLMAGDFSRLAPLFRSSPETSPCSVVRWYEDGLFATEPKALAEAFTCACFNGCAEVVEYLLSKGVDSSGGANTGLNAFHWAANRGQLEVVKTLIRSTTPLETPNAYGGTVLGCAVWSAIYESKSDHLQIIEALLEAGTRIEAAEYPTGDQRVNEVLKRYGAGRSKNEE